MKLLRNKTPIPPRTLKIDLTLGFSRLLAPDSPLHRVDLEISEDRID